MVAPIKTLYVWDQGFKWELSPVLRCSQKVAFKWTDCRNSQAYAEIGVLALRTAQSQ
jgi:hypothetical protein